MSLVPEELTSGAPTRAPLRAVGDGARAPVLGGRAKRALDLGGSLLLGALLVPVILVAAAAVALSSRGPVLFRQQRVGAGGRRFTVLKFRTMRVGAEDVLDRDEVLYRRYLSHGHKLPLDEDPRITAVGRLLRKTSIDELPQLWNVLRGEMSLVGPRPVLDSELARYGDAVELYLATRPGLTGAWQISGRSRVDYDERVALDTAYVEGWSLGGDLVILAKTPLVVLSCRGSV